MGKRVIVLAAADPQFVVVAALDSPDHPQSGQDAGSIAGIPALGVPLSGGLLARPEVVIDFSVASAAPAIVRACAEQSLPLVLATTGLTSAQADELRAAAAKIPLLWSPNMSLAVNLTMKLAEVAARALRDKDADVEILERHHRFKEDSPSGTALKFGRIVAACMGQTAERHGRQGCTGPRSHGEIGYHAIRAGDNPGEHTIVFGLLGETIELTVRATNRDCYAQGALAAARFLAGKPAGLYGMNDVLGW
jgi:4-hydroxy-tetrahydrodipicolinate reductase